MLLVILLFGIIVSMVLLARCSHKEGDNSVIQPIKEKSGGDTLDVAIEISPLSFHWTSDSLSGLDYEIMNGISRMTGRPVKFHPVSSLPAAAEDMSKGLYDILISSLPATESLKERFRITVPVYIDREVLVQLKTSDNFISTPDKLANDSVWVAEDSPFIQRIQNLSSEIGAPVQIISPEGQTAEHLVMRVARGEIPRAVVNESLAKRMQKDNYPRLDVSTPISFSQFQCWIVSDRDPELPASIDMWINMFKTTQDYRRILEFYGVE